MVHGCGMVFITAGMVVELELVLTVIARVEVGALTVAVVTRLFFRGTHENNGRRN